MSPANLPRWSLLVCVFSLVASCGGGGGGGGATPPPTVPPPAATYTVGGSVTGLAGVGLVLRNNNGNELAVAANGAIAFTTPLPGGSAYSVSVTTQPSSPAQVCVVTGGAGTIAAANVSSIVITCTTTTYPVNVNVSGLAGSGLVLRNNGANDLSVAANGISAFTTQIASGAAYNVTVGAQPHTPSQTCVIANPAGSVAAAGVTVTVGCTIDRFTVGGTIAGLVGSVSLRNGTQAIAFNANGAFTMPSAPDLSAYNVTIDLQPVDYTCSVTNGSGALAGTNVGDILVNCAINPPAAPVVTLERSLKRIDLTWPAAARAENYRVWRSDRGTGSTQVGASQTALTFADRIPVHLLDWMNGGYFVEACNSAGCMQSALVGFGDSRDAIGYFKASNRGQEDWFGLAVAVSGDGNTLAVSGYSEDSDSIGINASGANDNCNGCGAVYVYRRNGNGAWAQEAYVKASISEIGQSFGFDVALSHDGATLAVSAPYDDELGPDAGAIYIYTRAGTTWTQQARLKAHNAGQGDYFGNAIDLSGDGNTLLVGAPYESSSDTGIGGTGLNNNAPNSGAAYVFERAGTTWAQTTYIKASDTGNSDGFGWQVALSADASTIAIGSPGEDSIAVGVNGDQSSSGPGDFGAVYVFARVGPAWAQQAFLKTPFLPVPYVARGAHFGNTVALSMDGNTLVTSTEDEGSDARGVNGDANNGNAPESGAAYVFVRNGAIWTGQAYLKASNTGAMDKFGSSVAISGDGRVVAVTAYAEGGTTPGVGGDQDDDSGFSRGAVYLFERSVGVWTQSSYVHAKESGDGDLLGYLRSTVSLSIDGRTMAVGAYGEDGGGTGVNPPVDNTVPESGAVYLY